MKPKYQRLTLIILGLIGLALTAFFVLRAFEANLQYFYSPSDVAALNELPTRTLRVGGLVMAGTLHQQDHTYSFTITDTQHELAIHYQGDLPDLFREGQGVIAEGVLTTKAQFKASTLLAKHDETYMPPEVAKALKAAQEQHNKAVGK